MKNESVKESLKKSTNVLEENRKMTKRKNCVKKTNTFTIIALNFVQEQLTRARKFNHAQLTAAKYKLINARWIAFVRQTEQFNLEGM